MTDCMILGVPLAVSDGSPLATATPLAGFVVIKAFDADGDICYLTAATPDLEGVECLGMAEYAVMKLKRGLARALDDAEDA